MQELSVVFDRDLTQNLGFHLQLCKNIAQNLICSWLNLSVQNLDLSCGMLQQKMVLVGQKVIFQRLCNVIDPKNNTNFAQSLR